jgi:pimeloyl-ACP methyl ester carboxylesterase
MNEKGNEIKMENRLLHLLGPAVLALSSAVVSSAAAQTPALVASLGDGFKSENVSVNGTSIHYVRGGSGPAILLIHGFPEDWYEFHHLMPVLAKRFTVIAVDLRGVGDSAAAPDGYDAANLAEDLHQLAEHLQLKKIYIVGHDVGGMVAYAFLRKYPETLRGAMILDVAIPGLEPWDKVKNDSTVWHIRFHQTDLPEKLVAGRQVDYFRYFLGKELFSDADVGHYANAYRDPDHLKSAFEFYRAFPANETFNAQSPSPITVPVVFGVGERDYFAQFLSTIAASLRAHGCTNLKTEVIKTSAHYVAQEQPAALAALIGRYAAE